MDESDEGLSPRPQAEGVRIIRAEEAQAALDAGQAAGRRPEDAPRFGDVPAPPSGPRSPHRFPLPDSVDPASAVPRPAVRQPERRFGGRLTNRGKTQETVRTPAPPRVVRLLTPTESDAGVTAGAPAELRSDARWGADPGWTEDTVPRHAPVPADVGSRASGPKHFAKDPARPRGSEWVPSDAPVAPSPAPGLSDTAGPSYSGGLSDTREPSYAGGLSDTAGTAYGGAPSYTAGPPNSGGLGSSQETLGAHGTGYDGYRASLDPPLPPRPSAPGFEPPPPPPPPAPDLALPEEGINVHSGSTPELQHWTDPPTGEVPYILADREPSQGEEMAAWQALGSRGLRWRDEASDWDDLDDVSDLGGGDEAPLGALDTSRTEHSDMFSFDEQFERLEDERSGAVPLVDPVAVEPAPGPVNRRPAARRSQPTATRAGHGRGPGGPTDGRPASGGRDLQTATIVGVGMLLALFFAYFLGAAVFMLLATVIVTASALELYNLIQHRGFRPATLLGVCATVAVMLSAYWRGEVSVPLILALVFITSMLWYMLGVVDARPVVNVGLTVMTFVWIGVFGSYASLMLRVPNGKQLLLLPVLVTVAADTGAFFAGSSIGSRPLAPAVSPGKTWEGVIGGGIAAIVMSFLLSRLPFLSKTWTGSHALLLGLVIAVAAPLGDLCESMVKRDLDLKDSGSFLPGHGGLLDRFDALLFVLPATYYLVLYLKMG